MHAHLLFLFSLYISNHNDAIPDCNNKNEADLEMGRYVKKHIYGEGIPDVFKMIGKKVSGKTVKEAAKTASKKAVQTAATHLCPGSILLAKIC